MKTKNYNKFKAEELQQSIFKILRTEVLEERLEHLKRHPKKNKLGIIRIEEELYQRKEEQTQEYQNDTESLEQLVLSKINEMANILYTNVVTDPEYVKNLRKYSDKVKVLAEMQLYSEEPYGYLIQNISTESIELKDTKTNELITLKSGEIKGIERIKFIRITSSPEISFTLYNGRIKSSISLSELVKKEQAGWEEEDMLQQYRFTPNEGKLPIIYIEKAI